MNKKVFTVELGTDEQNNIDANEVHLALMKYFVAFVYIDVKEAAQQSFAPDSLKAHVACPQCAWLFEINLPAKSG